MLVARRHPDDFVPQLLPRLLRELLYPRYFYDVIVAEAEKHGADPRLVLSIMREESRFNPRAKSAAAARGLLQFIITTARDVGRRRSASSTSRPKTSTIPRSSSSSAPNTSATCRRSSTATATRAAAAYNAGPNQARLWAALAPGRGDDYFLSAISFDETKDYVRKVLNSYERYGEIYEGEPPAGGVRADP